MPGHCGNRTYADLWNTSLSLYITPTQKYHTVYCFSISSSGDNVVIEDSYIWDAVKIENNCRISKSLLCDKVLVKQYVFTDISAKVSKL
jgi:NDP-sugar pyrophosphorylase family protein